MSVIKGSYLVRDCQGRRMKLARSPAGSYNIRLCAADEDGPLILCRLLGKIVYVALPNHPHHPSCLPIFEPRSDGTVAIRDPLSDLYWASPVTASDGEVDLPADRLHVAEWETFQLEPVDVAEQYGDSLCLIDEFLRTPNQAAYIVTALRTSDVACLKLLSALHHCIGEAVYDAIAAHVAQHPDIVTSLPPSEIADPYLELALLPLLDARSSDAWRALPQSLDVGPRCDFLNGSSWGTSAGSLWHGLNAAMRRLQRPNRNLCMVTTVRNEGVYLLEWIAFHRRHRVEHFFIYTNDNDDLSDPLLSAISSLGFVTVISNSAVPLGASAQNKAYAHALTILLPILDFTWCGIIDVDEFVVFDPVYRDTSLEGILDASRHADALVLTWATIGSQDGAPGVACPLIERCTRLFCDDERVIKSFVKPQRFIHSSPHVPAGGGDRPRYIVDVDHELFSCVSQTVMADPRIFRAISSRRSSRRLVLFHFFYKTALEYVWKFSRNRGDYPKAIGMVVVPVPFAVQFLAQREKPATHSWAAGDACDLRVDVEGLLSRPAIKSAYENVLSTFETRCSTIAEFACVGQIQQAEEVRELLTIAFGAAALTKTGTQASTSDGMPA